MNCNANTSHQGESSDCTDMQVDDNRNCQPKLLNYFTWRFPAILYEVLRTCSNGAIRWSEDGNLVIIRKTQFCSMYLPSRYFRTKLSASFHRQLNLYGFNKVPLPAVHGQTSCCCCTDEEAYHHRYFKRDREDLLWKIVRKRQGAVDVAASIANITRKKRCVEAHEEPPVEFSPQTEPEWTTEEQRMETDDDFGPDDSPQVAILQEGNVEHGQIFHFNAEDQVIIIEFPDDVDMITWVNERT